MSRAKSRQNTDVCGDCGAQDPTWASVNKGILLCIHCCSIHRSLGRHISQVKSLQKSPWHKIQLDMVHALNHSGVNNIWEHALLESNSKLAKKKPNPKDPLSVKADFIRAKHQQCLFTFKPSNDGIVCVENELGKQLHGSVRISNLETSFRLLINGADPNYFHDEKGTTPLHVAVRNNQKLQAELLMVYGADPTFPDAQRRTPIDYARQNGDKDLVNRLIEWQYEVTDRFTNYLTHRRPDHQNGIHFILPQSGSKSDPNAMAKLKKLPNHLFEELVMDVYDEIDRRETEAIWLSSADTIELSAVPFLPVDPSLSTTRNQGRQKLARFSSPELNSLVYDILVDTQRRHLAAERGQLPQLREYSQISDDDPLYDSVASDEDYAVVPMKERENQAQAMPTTTKISESVQCDDDNGISDKMEQLTKQLQESDTRIMDLKAEVTKLRAYAESLKNENCELKSRLSQVKCDNNRVDYNSNKATVNGEGPVSLDGFLMNRDEESKALFLNGRVIDPDLRHNRRGQRPNSMYETREGLRTPNWQTLKNQLKHNEQQRNVTHSLYTSTQHQTVMQCTEQVTKGIQALCKCLLTPSGREECLSCAENIRYAVTNLISALQTEVDADLIRSLRETVQHLQMECSSLQLASKNREESQVDFYVLKIKECAYNIAKDTKEIVTKYTTH